MMRGVRRGILLLATGAIVIAGGAAVAQVPPGAIVQPLGPDRGAELRGYLTTLADNPENLDALIGAGRAALDMGDTDAALNFFGRADQIAPRNPRVKAGIASTLVELGEAQPALRTFGEAVALGAPEAEIAADRGLAHDMVGDPRRAQQDYLVSLRHREDPEVRRRLALSLAISGQREAALRLIDAQLRANDRAAWRTQAFILALTGDAAGADRTALSAMPPGSARDLAPFFARLHGLSPSQKAMAVHLGRFPTGAQARTQVAHVDTSPDPAAVALALGRPAVPTTSRPAAATASRRGSARESRSSRQAETRTREARRRPEPVFDSSDPYGLRQPAATTATRETESRPSPAPAQGGATPARQTEIAELNTRWAGAPYSGAEIQPTSLPPVQPPPAPQVQPAPVPRFQPPASEPSSPVVAPQPQPAPTIASNVPAATQPAVPAIREVEVPAASLGAPLTSPLGPAAGAEIAVASTEPAAAATVPEPAKNEAPATESSSLADIAALVNALPQESEPAPAATPAAPPRATRAAPTRTAEARTPRTRTPPANPARHWVQIATGPDRDLLPREFARLRALAPEQFARRSAYTTPLRATNRLLVGPFASTREAQEFVNQLAHRNVSAFAWTSAAGQEIDRVQTR